MTTLTLAPMLLRRKYARTWHVVAEGRGREVEMRCGEVVAAGAHITLFHGTSWGDRVICRKCQAEPS